MIKKVMNKILLTALSSVCYSW